MTRGSLRRSLPRVLIIEDDKDAADTLQELLELRGHEVDVAYSGPDAIAKPPTVEMIDRVVREDR